MPETPLHPLIVHFPMALAILVPPFMGIVLMAWRRGRLPKCAWFLPVLAQAVLVGTAVFASRTGEAEEDRVEAVVAEAPIETHEEAAEVFTWSSGAVLLIALVALGLKDEKRARMVALLGLLGSIGVLGLGYRVGKAGGELVYRHGAAAAWASPGGGGLDAPIVRRHDEDDDD